MFKLALLAALAVAVIADPIHHDKLRDEINHTIDQAVKAFEKSPTFDPMNVPEHREKFERHLGIITIKGDVLMKHIEVRGLKNLKRQGDANVKNDNGVLKAHVLLGVHEDDGVTIDSDIAYHIGDIHPEVHVVSDIQDFVIEVELDVNEQGNVTLASFEVTEFRNVVNHIQGLSILDPVFSVLSDVMTLIFNNQVRNEMTKVLYPAFEKELEKPHELLAW